MTTPTEPAAAPESLKEAAHRIAEESAAAQGLPLEATDPGILHQIARIMLQSDNLGSGQEQPE
jgi:hypothetical protein